MHIYCVYKIKINIYDNIKYIALLLHRHGYEYLITCTDKYIALLLHYHKYGYIV